MKQDQFGQCTVMVLEGSCWFLVVADGFTRLLVVPGCSCLVAFHPQVRSKCEPMTFWYSTLQLHFFGKHFILVHFLHFTAKVADLRRMDTTTNPTAARRWSLIYFLRLHYENQIGFMRCQSTNTCLFSMQFFCAEAKSICCQLLLLTSSWWITTLYYAAAAMNENDLKVEDSMSSGVSGQTLRIKIW